MVEDHKISLTHSLLVFFKKKIFGIPHTLSNDESGWMRIHVSKQEIP